MTREYFYLNNQIQDQSLILPSNYCYPYPSFLINSAVRIKDEIMKETFAIHHWEMSWMKCKYIKRIINKIIYIFKSKIIKKYN